MIDDFPLEPAALGPAQVHAQQHLGPVLRLGAPRARVNRDDGVLSIVLAAEHLLDLAGLHLLIERLESCPELASTASPASAHSTSTARSSLFFRSDCIRSRSCST